VMATATPISILPCESVAKENHIRKDKGNRPQSQKFSRLV
jgi:hypothetical protein